MSLISIFLISLPTPTTHSYTPNRYTSHLCVYVSSSVVDCSLPGSFVHGILQARILKWAAIPFSWGSSRPRDQTWVSCFIIWAPGKSMPLLCMHNSNFYTLTLVIMQQIMGWLNWSSPNWKTYLKKFMW